MIVTYNSAFCFLSIFFPQISAPGVYLDLKLLIKDMVLIDGT